MLCLHRDTRLLSSRKNHVSGAQTKSDRRGHLSEFNVPLPSTGLVAVIKPLYPLLSTAELDQKWLAL